MTAKSNPSALKAIHILKQIKAKHGPSMLAYWVTPNTILTLSGARAYCDGVFWSKDKKQLESWSKDIAESLKTIQANCKIITSENGVQTIRDNEMYVGYDIIFEDGLNYVLKNTSIVKIYPSNLIQSHHATSAHVVEWVMDILAKQEQFKDYSKEDLNHVAFGILLGYPGTAIIGAVKNLKMDDPLAEPLISAAIRGGDYYVCPQPVYDYPRHLVNNPKIKAHEELWSGILEDYYHSDFHKSLETDQSFKRKMSELGNLK